MARVTSSTRRYKIGGVLGRGSFSTVRDCVCLNTDSVFAAKVIESDNDYVSVWSNCSMFKREVDFLRSLGMSMHQNSIRLSLDHPNIVMFIDAYQDKSNMFIVTEKCSGGEVFDKLVAKKRFSEPEVASIAIQAFSAIAYVHSKNIIHRDIKAENFLFAADGSIKLIDFGLAVRIKADTDVLTAIVGSAHYLAPEMVKQHYSRSVDIWSAGVMIYLMLYGRYPFDGTNDDAVIKKIKKGDIDWSTSTSFFSVSDKAIGFTKALLDKDVTKRLTAKQALCHSFLDIPKMVSSDDDETVDGYELIKQVPQLVERRALRESN